MVATAAACKPNLAAASECEMCAATLPVVASAASSTRKKRKSALVTVYPPRSEEYCDLQFEAKSKRGGKEETSVSRKYCRWKAEYGVREVRCFCLHVASISVELSAGVYCPTLCVARAKLVGRDHDGNTRHASLSNHCPCGFLSALLLVSALLCLLSQYLTQCHSHRSPTHSVTGTPSRSSAIHAPANYRPKKTPKPSLSSVRPNL